MPSLPGSSRPVEPSSFANEKDSKSMDDLVARIAQAHAARPVATPLEFSPLLSAGLGGQVYLKCEHLQPTGSFQICGAPNKNRLFSAQPPPPGGPTASPGNPRLGGGPS